MSNYYLLTLNQDELDIVRRMLAEAGKEDLLRQIPQPKPPGEGELELKEEYIDRAQERHSGDNDVSFDERVAVSLERDGAWVAAWLWLSKEDLHPWSAAGQEEETEKDFEN